MKVKDKVAIVTGGGGGIGRAICIDLARQGAVVVVSDINLKTATKVADELKALGHNAVAMKADVMKSEELNQMVKSTLDQFGRVDILVNCHGGGAREKKSFFHESTEEVRDTIIDINLKGVLNSCRAVIEHMIEKRSGKIINIASAAGILGSVMGADYAAAKAGVIIFTKALAKEVGPYGVYVNCVSPGSIDTSARPKTSEYHKQRLATTPLGRFGRGEEIASVVTFLASDEASFITGQNIAVCGGRTAWGETDNVFSLYAIHDAYKAQRLAQDIR